METIDKDRLKEMGWTITSESPLEVEHEDGSKGTGKVAEEIVRNKLNGYSTFKKTQEKRERADNMKKVVDKLDLSAINGREIIDFINKNDRYMSWSGKVSLIDQKLEKSKNYGDYYELQFLAHWDNWGQKTPCEYNFVYIYKDNGTIEVCPEDPIDGDISDLEDVLVKWLDTHEFEFDEEHSFDELIREAYQMMPEISMTDKEGMERLMNKLEEAKTYMK